MKRYIRDFGNEKDTIGGTFYDITKIPKREQREYLLGNLGQY